MRLERGHVPASTSKVSVLSVRPLAREELYRLAEKRSTLGPPVQKLRDSHHNVARCIAMGMRDLDIAIKTGFSRSRIQVLKADPTFKNLIEEYRGLVQQSFKESADDYMELLVNNMTTAERMIADRLEAAEEEAVNLPVKDLLAISRDAADRTGRGKKTTNVNVNIDFAASLEKAIKRSNGKTIEGVARPLPPPQQAQKVMPPITPSGPETLVRRV